jgi:hypothetical protein
MAARGAVGLNSATMMWPTSLATALKIPWSFILMLRVPQGQATGDAAISASRWPTCDGTPSS